MDYAIQLRGSGRRLTKEEEVDEEYFRKLSWGDDDVNVDYWRSRAGWADDDASMIQYNQGVYNSMRDGGNGYNGSSSASMTAKAKAAARHPFVFMGALAAVLFCLFMICCCNVSKKGGKKSAPKKKKSAAKTKDSSRELRDKHGERRSRSRSRARASEKKVSDDYQLMDGGDEEDNKSSKRRDRDGRSVRSSSRSRARSTERSSDRSRATSKSRSKSKSRSDGKISRSRSKSRPRETVDATENQKMLV
ncbi:hypothetical protein ACHAWC_001104 [Mediolabrus comicus]